MEEKMGITRRAGMAALTAFIGLTGLVGLAGQAAGRGDSFSAFNISGSWRCVGVRAGSSTR
jgi:hypothetical protein